MAIRKLEKSDWQRYMDRVSKHLPTTNVSISVEGLDLGDQIEADRIALIGISYDRHDDALEIATEPVAHRISSPLEIWVDESEGALRALEVKDTEGHVQIIRLDRAMALPAA